MGEQILHSFFFKGKTSSVIISQDLPNIEQLTAGFSLSQTLVVCDSNTQAVFNKIHGSEKIPFCVLPSGEKSKTWQSVEEILKAAVQAGIGRDGLFIGIGGGVITDMTAFAAAIYMRGISVRLVSTTILGMVDASVGGKTGFDLFGIKNLVGAFHPAEEVFMPLSTLESLPKSEWKSGFAEILKTGIIADPEILKILEFHSIDFTDTEVCNKARTQNWFMELVHRCVAAKGKIVESDPEETGTERALLNLGHTYGHALEAIAGLGNVSHGEAVAWGIGRACELGTILGITPSDRKRYIIQLLKTLGYCTDSVYPCQNWDPNTLIQTMYLDKKKKNGQLRFIIPDAAGAIIRTIQADEIAMVFKTLQKKG